MAIPLATRESDSAVLVLPILSNGLAFPSVVGRPVQLALAGWDGRLTGQLITDALRVRWLDGLGDVSYSRAAGELLAALSPYRAYVRIQLLDGTWVSAPMPPDYFLVTVEPDGY